MSASNATSPPVEFAALLWKQAIRSRSARSGARSTSTAHSLLEIIIKCHYNLLVCIHIYLSDVFIISFRNAEAELSSGTRLLPVSADLQ